MRYSCSRRLDKPGQCPKMSSSSMISTVKKVKEEGQTQFQLASILAFSWLGAWILDVVCYMEEPPSTCRIWNVTPCQQKMIRYHYALSRMCHWGMIGSFCLFAIQDEVGRLEGTYILLLTFVHLWEQFWKCVRVKRYQLRMRSTVYDYDVWNSWTWNPSGWSWYFPEIKECVFRCCVEYILVGLMVSILPDFLRNLVTSVLVGAEGSQFVWEMLFRSGIECPYTLRVVPGVIESGRRYPRTLVFEDDDNYETSNRDNDGEEEDEEDEKEEEKEEEKQKEQKEQKEEEQSVSMCDQMSTILHILRTGDVPPEEDEPEDKKESNQEKEEDDEEEEEDNRMEMWVTM